MRRTRLTLAVTLAAAVVGVPAAPSALASPALASPALASSADVDVQLIAMNDFHGRISETTGGDATLTDASGATITVGGAANVASTVRATRQAFLDAGGSEQASTFVGAGDLISASPFNSSVFSDEPTIEVLNAMGLDVSSVGNHEFDRGTEELRRISAATDGEFSDDVTACQGVTRGVDGCYSDSTGADFHGTDFPYLAANVVTAGTDTPMLPPYEILDVGSGQRMALIGVVTSTTPTIVAPDGITDVEFIDEATAINRYVPELQAQGIEAIGVLIHEGGENTGADAANPDGCAQLTGPLVDINDRTDAAVDLIISAHSHQAYDCLLTDPAGQPRLVTQAGFYGRLISDIRLVIDGSTGDVDRLCGTYAAANVPVTRTNPDPTVAGIVAYWNDRSAAAGDEVAGSATADIRRAGAFNPDGTYTAVRDAESSLGNLVAQAQLEAVQSPTYGDPVLAFMNPGGLRTDILAGDVTYGELFAVQPFGNTVNVTTLTGAGIRAVLEQQFQADGGPRASNLRLGTSAGFAYSFDPAQPYGQRVDPASITVNGVPIEPAASYRVAANSFLIGGGDSFTAFTNGTDPATGPVDVDTAVAYFANRSPVAPPAADHGTPTSFTSVPEPATGLGGSAAEPEVVGTTTGTSGTLGVAAAGFTCPTTATPPPTPPPTSTPTPAPTPTPTHGVGGGGAAGGPPTTGPVAAGGGPGTGPGAATGATGGTASGTTGTRELANTGTATGQLLGAGGLLLVTGGVAIAAGYRRRRGLTG